MSFEKKSVCKQDVIWFHNDLYKLIKERETLSRLFRNTADGDVLRDFKIARNKATQAMCDARSSYIAIKVSNKSNPRKFWRLINDLQNKSESTVYDDDFCSSHG